MMKGEIKSVEIYYEDDSMVRVTNDKPSDKKLTKEQTEYIIDHCLNTLDNFRNFNAPTKKVTVDNYHKLTRDHTDMTNEHFNMMISLLNTLT